VWDAELGGSKETCICWGADAAVGRGKASEFGGLGKTGELCRNGCNDVDSLYVVSRVSTQASALWWSQCDCCPFGVKSPEKPPFGA